MGARQARIEIRKYIKRNEDREESLLKKFLEMETDACHAATLNRLLQKRWDESPDSYRICSKITPK